MGAQGFCLCCWQEISFCQVAPDQTVRFYHILGYGIAILYLIVDLGIDISTVVHYFVDEQDAYASATIVIILVSSYVISCVSYRMFKVDRKRERSHMWNKNLKLRIAMHVLPLALLLRCIDSFKYALKSWWAGWQRNSSLREHYYQLMLKENVDCALLQLFECFLESAPQQVLQVSYMLGWVSGENTMRTGLSGYYPLFSATLSFLGMAWCLKTYKNIIRKVQEDKANIGRSGDCFIFLWQLFITISRISMLSAMLYLSWYTLVAMAIHILIMTVSMLRTENHMFCNSDKSFDLGTASFLEKLGNNLFTTIFAVVSIFTYIPLNVTSRELSRPKECRRRMHTSVIASLKL
ncbi:XK-related protein 6-like isoform X2 [Thrips palmi]|uniref:XK-related protein n=1 Tax=Thrips palmi TaxID=161013 RepID=A0A6P8XTQ2_THRPL|nr:XK-related protein 6-like isoform X2 [Thrips palmi]